MKLTDITIPKTAFIYSAIHLLANQLQTLGDKIDPTISTKQWFVLAAVSKFKEVPPNIGDIAELLGTSRQNIKKIAGILEQRGYLQLKRDKNDMRNIQLFLTDSCHIYFKSREQQEEAYFEQLFYGMKEEELNALYGGMNRLIENIDHMLEGELHGERER